MAWATAISAYARRVASLSTSPSGVSRPQCPCEVNSSRQRSLITTVASPTSATTSRMATLRMPAGSMPPEPVASRSAGTPKSMMPPTPAWTASAAALRSESRECWTTPGREPIGRGSVSPSLTNIGRISSAGSSRVSATSRRSAGVRRSRRGRIRGYDMATSWRTTGTVSAVGPCTLEPRRCLAGIAASFSRSSTAYAASASTRSGTGGVRRAARRPAGRTRSPSRPSSAR